MKSIIKPWGYYITLVSEKNYKVKKIVVYPNKRLSLQKHFFRQEKWIVCDGSGKVQINDNIFNVKIGDDFFIDKEILHRLSNDTNEILTIIEVQIGTILKENDIIRVEDDFNRNGDINGI
jgi:mannose-6-phosphate isomerase-like protein (cupin superfamily)